MRGYVECAVNVVVSEDILWAGAEVGRSGEIEARNGKE